MVVSDLVGLQFIEIEGKIQVYRQTWSGIKIFHRITLNIWDVNPYGIVGKYGKKNPEFCCSRDSVPAILANMAIAFGKKQLPRKKGVSLTPAFLFDFKTTLFISAGEYKAKRTASLGRLLHICLFFKVFENKLAQSISTTTCANWCKVSYHHISDLNHLNPIPAFFPCLRCYHMRSSPSKGSEVDVEAPIIGAVSKW